MNTEPEQQSSDQPVAYDAEGKPLYAAPQPKAEHQVVHFTRAIDPQKPDISPAVQEKHAASMKQFPRLNLSEGEYIISAVRRHPIGLVGPVLITALLLGLIVSGLANYEAVATAIGLSVLPEYGPILLTGVLAILLVLIGGYIAVWVYLSNAFYLTNESVIQEIQVSLFARNEQTVSLSNIEDASYTQHGILQTLLDYGSIRLSTEGDETTYRFSYVADPKREIAILNNAVEAFKNGRPVSNEED